MLEEARIEPRNRKLPQSKAILMKTEMKRTARVRRQREGHWWHGESEKSNANCRQKSNANWRSDTQHGFSLDTRWEDSWTEIQKQTAISLSSCEAEFCAAMGSRPLVWTRRTLRGTFYDKCHRHRAIKVGQSFRSETDWYWREQDGSRHCRQQAVQVRWDLEQSEVHVNQDLIGKDFIKESTHNPQKLWSDPTVSPGSGTNGTNGDDWENDWELEQRFQSSRRKYSQLHHDHDHAQEHDYLTTSRLQQPRQWVGVLSKSHPGLCGTPVGPCKDTHGTLGPVRGKAVGGPTTSHDRHA